MEQALFDSWHSYPRIYALGHNILSTLLEDDDVIIEEKLDGSQFSFGLFPDGLRCRSKGAILNILAPEKMFLLGVEAVKTLDLTPGWTYSGEYFQRPKHNTLAYDRIPKNHVMIFDIRTGQEKYLKPEEREAECKRIGLEPIPILARGRIDRLELFRELLDTVSCLGGQKVEGVVCKNYKKFGPDGKALMGKFVSEAFKEVHGPEWKSQNPTHADIKTILANKYKSAARWNKAIQHLKEAGKLSNEPKDIGILIPEVRRDLLEECKAEISEQLFDWAWPHIERACSAGLPDFYKELLLKRQFETEN